jgi:hypothetical protein
MIGRALAHLTQRDIENEWIERERKGAFGRQCSADFEPLSGGMIAARGYDFRSKTSYAPQRHAFYRSEFSKTTQP